MLPQRSSAVGASGHAPPLMHSDPGDCCLAKLHKTWFAALRAQGVAGN